MLSWSIFPDPFSAKLSHVFWQTAALSSLIAAMVAVVKDKNDGKQTSLTTIHSWLGVATIIVFCINYMFGFWMWFLKVVFPDNKIKEAIDLRLNHRTIGAIAFGLTVITILTGIMDEFGKNGCDYLQLITYPDKNPGSHYKDMPIACRIGNGLGITVYITAFLTIVVVALRLNRQASEAVKKMISKATIDAIETGVSNAATMVSDKFNAALDAINNNTPVTLFSVSTVLSIFVVIFSLIAIGLVSGWTGKSPETDPLYNKGFLGKFHLKYN